MLQVGATGIEEEEEEEEGKEEEEEDLQNRSQERYRLNQLTQSLKDVVKLDISQSMKP
jgi:hypothetical protein